MCSRCRLLRRLHMVRSVGLCVCVYSHSFFILVDVLVVSRTGSGVRVCYTVLPVWQHPASMAFQMAFRPSARRMDWGLNLLEGPSWPTSCYPSTCNLSMMMFSVRSFLVEWASSCVMYVRPHQQHLDCVGILDAFGRKLNFSLRASQHVCHWYAC